MSSANAAPKVIPFEQHGVARERLSPCARKVVVGLQEAGYAAFVVGGAVRDLLVDLEPKDFDVATSATPEQVRAEFRNARIIGRRFRLVHVHFGREIIEVATFRAGHGADDAEEDSNRAAHHESGRILRDNVYGTLEDDAQLDDRDDEKDQDRGDEGELEERLAGLAGLPRISPRMPPCPSRQQLVPRPPLPSTRLGGAPTPRSA